ncbi:Serine-threonine/tyrosine-protein kinase, catalytic domain [Sesbania bispinosa]|nr:Serine-threonine/tyrosine-protein kinase, catalytic domain [Sesbania bispinosa]
MAEALNLKPKKGLGSLFSSSASAQGDLRHLDLEKEKDDETTPRGVLEACVREFDSHKPPESETSSSSSSTRSHWSKFFKLWKKSSFKRLASIPASISVPKIPKWKSRSTRENPARSKLYNFRCSLVTFSLSDLRNATNNFSKENLIGRGGFAEVYKGVLQDGQLIAVKKMTKGTTDEKTAGFLSELGVSAHVDHPNTAKIIGCGVEGEMHLVFELSPLGSLGSLLHGLFALDLESYDYALSLRVPWTIICDFGLAKWLPEQWTHHNVSKFEGTFGYFAPEYCMHGIVDEKTDVYSFGVLLLEIITGRPALSNLQQSVVIWAKPLLDTHNIKDLVDPSLGDDYDREQMRHVVLTASLCVEQSPISRPRMSQASRQSAT